MPKPENIALLRFSRLELACQGEVRNGALLVYCILYAESGYVIRLRRDSLRSHYVSNEDWWRWLDSNQRLYGYEPYALTN